MHFFSNHDYCVENYNDITATGKFIQLQSLYIYIDQNRFYYGLYFVFKISYRHRRTPNGVILVFKLYNLNTRLSFNIIFIRF